MQASVRRGVATLAAAAGVAALAYVVQAAGRTAGRVRRAAVGREELDPRYCVR